MKRKFKTKRDVHIRSGAPRRGEDNTVGFFQAGRVLTLEVEPVDDEECEMIAGNNTWYRIGGDLYVWDGDFEDLNRSGRALDHFDIKEYWWLNDFEIDGLWDSGLTGKNVKIAVLDSGLSLPHPDLALEKAQLKDVLDNDTGLTDHWGHGTHTAGIIKATNNEFGVKGIAYNCDFYFGKVKHDIKGDKIEFLIKGLEWALKQQVHIVSISMGFKKDTVALREVIQTLFREGTLVVCAAGNNEEPSDDRILFPAGYEETLSVGGIKQNLNPLDNTIDTENTDLFAPGQNILSTYKDEGYESLSGSSQACPYVAAIAGLLLERKDPDQLEPGWMKEILLDSARDTPFGKIIHPIAIMQS